MREWEFRSTSGDTVVVKAEDEETARHGAMCHLYGPPRAEDSVPVYGTMYKGQGLSLIRVK
jgi:hypothetical protein